MTEKQFKIGDRVRTTVNCYPIPIGAVGTIKEPSEPFDWCVNINNYVTCYYNESELEPLPSTPNDLITHLNDTLCREFNTQFDGRTIHFQIGSAVIAVYIEYIDGDGEIYCDITYNERNSGSHPVCSVNESNELYTFLDGVEFALRFTVGNE